MICCPCPSLLQSNFASFQVTITILSQYLCNLKIPKNSQRIPKEFPKNSQRIPKEFPKNSQRISKAFPKNFQRIPKEFPKKPQRIPIEFLKNSRRISKEFPKNSRKIPQRIPQRIPKESPQKFLKFPQNCLEISQKYLIRAYSSKSLSSLFSVDFQTNLSWHQKKKVTKK